MDIFLVTCARDIKLLRHFFLSCELFFKATGAIHCFVWKRERRLLEQIDIPDNVTVWWKDDVSQLIADDFRNQLYLKLISHRYVNSDWFWIVDSDFLICRTMSATELLRGGRPKYFYKYWDGGIEETTWRKASEAIIGRPIPYNFMRLPEYIMHREILRQLGESLDLESVLRAEVAPSEFILYGAYAYERYFDMYQWSNVAHDQSSLGYLVNQRGPMLCDLNTNVDLDAIGAAKYAVLWSHWDEAEFKMAEFLRQAQLRELGGVVAEPDLSPIHISASKEEINAGGLLSVNGAYSDGWVKKQFAFAIDIDDDNLLEADLEAPHTPDDSGVRLDVMLNGEKLAYILEPRNSSISMPLKQQSQNRLMFRFSGGVSESNGGRTLYARAASCRIVSQQHGENVRSCLHEPVSSRAAPDSSDAPCHAS